MARLTVQDEALSETLKARGGFAQFRTVSEHAKETRDSPFGTPSAKSLPAAKPAVTEVAPAEVEPPQPVPPATPAQRPSKPKPREAKPATSESIELDTENVTLPLSRSLRDRAEDLARILTRNRTVKKFRITRNAIIRVALESTLEMLSDPSEHSVNSEDELLELVRSLQKR